MQLLCVTVTCITVYTLDVSHLFLDTLCQCTCLRSACDGQKSAGVASIMNSSQQSQQPDSLLLRTITQRLRLVVATITQLVVRHFIVESGWYKLSAQARGNVSSV